jgi:pilus assembly protein Flp/PilA
MSAIPTLVTATVRQFRRFRDDERAATAIEYGLIAAGVGATVAGTVWSLGSHLKTTFYDRLAALL